MPDEPLSRRERPAKPPLSREWIVSTTLDIVRREGLSKATMRRVARELDTGAASLYVYVRNTTELHAAVLDALIGDLPPSSEGTYQQRIEAVLAAYRDRLLAHPGLSRAALAVRPSGPNTLALFDRLLGLFVEEGVPARRAAWGVDLLLLTVTAMVVEHAAGDADPIDEIDPDERQHAIEQAVLDASETTTPYLARYAADVVGGAPLDRWRWKIQTQIEAIATGAYQPTPDHHDRGPDPE